MGVCCVYSRDQCADRCQPIPQADLPLSAEYDVCRCSIIARPCCTTIFGECVIETQEYCNFYNGFYHNDTPSCSQTDCMQSACGLGTFAAPYRPDQWYRLFLSFFLHVGVIHVLLVAFLHCFIIADVERVCRTVAVVCCECLQMAGWWRTGMIYIISGVGGMAVSTVFVPYQVTVGASCAAFGMFGALLIDLLQCWQASELCCAVSVTCDRSCWSRAASCCGCCF